MIHLSEKMHTVVPWFRKRPRHRGEQLSFDPPENLQNSKYKGEKSESCFSCSSIYTAHSLVESAHIYTCRCEPKGKEQVFYVGKGQKEWMFNHILSSFKHKELLEEQLVGEKLERIQRVHNSGHKVKMYIPILYVGGWK